MGAENWSQSDRGTKSDLQVALFLYNKNLCLTKQEDIAFTLIRNYSFLQVFEEKNVLKGQCYES